MIIYCDVKPHYLFNFTKLPIQLTSNISLASLAHILYIYFFLSILSNLSLTIFRQLLIVNINMFICVEIYPLIRQITVLNRLAFKDLSTLIILAIAISPSFDYLPFILFTLLLFFFLTCIFIFFYFMYVCSLVIS